MTADEIRAASNWGSLTMENEPVVNVLVEIAAQLAEWNEHQRERNRLLVETNNVAKQNAEDYRETQTRLRELLGSRDESVSA